VTAREFQKVEKRLAAIEQAILELAEALRRSDIHGGGVVLPSTPTNTVSDRQNAPRLPRRVVGWFRA